MQPTGTHINYYHICFRKLWLFVHGLQMEHQSLLVQEGKLIHETTYEQRAKKYKELELDNIKIDHFDAQNKVIHEIKKSNKCEASHIAQVKYYLWVLLQHGVEATAILEYPKLRKKEVIILEKQDVQIIPTWITQIEEISNQENCPPTINKTICKNCSYQDFCYS